MPTSSSSLLSTASQDEGKRGLCSFGRGGPGVIGADLQLPSGPAHGASCSQTGLRWQGVRARGGGTQPTLPRVPPGGLCPTVQATLVELMCLLGASKLVTWPEGLGGRSGFLPLPPWLYAGAIANTCSSALCLVGWDEDLGAV